MAERAFLLLHGLANHRPPGHWHHWLADRLRGRGEQVVYPQLPEPDAPMFAAWRDALVDALGGLGGGGARVVVCHSLSCSLWLRAAPELTTDRLVLVAPPDPPAVPASGADLAYVPDDLDPSAIRASVRDELLLVHGDGDPYDPDGAAAVRVAALADRVVHVPGGGHLSEDDGFGPWPLIERLVLGEG